MTERRVYFMLLITLYAHVLIGLKPHINWGNPDASMYTRIDHLLGLFGLAPSPGIAMLNKFDEYVFQDAAEGALIGYRAEGDITSVPGIVNALG